MPIGNGDIGCNFWVEPNGKLNFLLSKTDCWSENGRLLKLGKICLILEPNPFKKGLPFCQELNLNDGIIKVEAGNYGDEVKIKVFVDANYPVLSVNVESKKETGLKVVLDHWRTHRRKLSEIEELSAYGIDGDSTRPVFVEPDTILHTQNNSIIWCHQNRRSIWKENLELQALNEIADGQDYLLHRTFGCMVKGKGLVSKNDTSIISQKPEKKFSLSMYALTSRASVLDFWSDSIMQIAKEVNEIPENERETSHRKWWRNFWKKSYIYVTSKDPLEKLKVDSITLGYNLQRYINACSGRGNSAIKFNGSIFTVDTYGMEGDEGGFNADYRRWGGPYWWQNTRFPYWSMLQSGDFTMMQPLFKMYMNALPLRELATRKYYTHSGAFFPETIYPWGTYNDNNYGRDRSGKPNGLIDNKYIRYCWQNGLELSLMMLDYYAFTQDNEFLKEVALPFTAEILTFYGEHWKRGSDGKILFDPAMSLETYGKAINPLPEIAGINKVCTQVLILDDSFTKPSLKELCKHLLADLPDIPTRKLDDRGKILAPAKEYTLKQNSENPELYAVFPYRLYGVGKSGLDMARLTYENREFKKTGGWHQAAIQAACLGLKKEAAALTIKNFTTSNPLFRFPAMWGPNHDWTPDQDHGNVAMIALQRMLLQYDAEQILLFPAWPDKWNVSFRLYAPNKTIVEGKLDGGKMIYFKVSPKGRKENITNCY